MMIKDDCLHPAPHLFLKIPIDYVIDYDGKYKNERENDSKNSDEGLFAVTNEIIE